MTVHGIPQSPNAKPRFFYGYIVVVAAFLIMLVNQGIYIAFGIFFKPLLTEFGWTRAVTSGAFSLSMIISGLLGVAMGGLTDRYGPRIVLTFCGFLIGLGYLLMSQTNAIWQLYLFYGVIIGIGMAGGWIPLTSTVARWFVKRRAMMTGFVIAGQGIGVLIASMVGIQLISTYDWRVAYIILGSVALIAVVSAAQFLKHDPQRKGLVAYSQNESKEHVFKPRTKSISFKKAVYTRQLWLLVAMDFCYGASKFAILVHIALHVIELGISATIAASILATLGGVSILGNIVFGNAGDRIGNRQAFAGGLILMSAALFWLITATAVWQLYLFASIFGFAYGISAVESPLVAEHFGLKSHGSIYGVMSLGFTMGATVGPVLAGYIFDVNGSYQMAFLVFAAVSIVGLILTALLKPIRGEWE